MTVTVTDRRTIVDEAEATTNWTGVGFGTTSSDVAEATNAVAEAINIGNAAMYYTQPTGSVNLGTSPGTLVYVYSFNNALQNAWDASPPPNALLLGDGTDRIAFDMAGNNKRVFNHLDGPTNWQCLVLDTGQASAMNSAGNTYVDAGSFAGLNFGAITVWGTYFQTGSKALGGGYNVACDIIRYGNDGIRVAGGLTGTRGTFLEVVTEDRSTANQKAHGIIRELGTGLYGVQGPLTFGDSGSATASYFEDSNVVIAFEDRNIGDDKYYFDVEGHATPTNLFILTGCTIQTGGPSITCGFNGGNITTLTLDACVIATGGGDVTFSNAADASGHTVSGCTFNGCNQIDPGDVTFEFNTISNSTDTTEGAMLLDADGTANITDLSFVSAGTGHAIYIPSGATGTYDFDNFSVSGYAVVDGSTGNEVVYNNSGGAVTINVSNASGLITVRNGTSATTTLVVDPVTTQVHVVDINTGLNIASARVYLVAADATGDFPFEKSCTIARVTTVATVTMADHGLQVGDIALIAGADQQEYNGAQVVTTIVPAVSFTFTVAGSPTTPATGTITTTGGYFNEATPVGGIVTDTRSITLDQPVTGIVRRSSSSPLYKSSPLDGVVDNVTGLSILVQMIPDE